MPKLQVLGLIFDSFNKRKEKATQRESSGLVLARVPGVSGTHRIPVSNS